MTPPPVPNRPRISLPALRDYGIYFALLVLVAYFSLRCRNFAPGTMRSLILLQVSVIGIIAVGMTFTIITAGIDLSVGSLLAIAGIVSGQFAQKDPTPCQRRLRFRGSRSSLACSAER